MFLTTCSHLCNQSSVSHPGDQNRQGGGGGQKCLAFSDAETSAAESQAYKTLPNWTHPLPGLHPVVLVGC